METGMNHRPQMHRINPGGEPALWVFHEPAGSEEISGLVLSREGTPPELARMTLNPAYHTQRVQSLLAKEGRLYEPHTALLALGALRPGDIALDIGAHVGFFAHLFRLAVGATGQVFAFEPLPDTYRRLVSNVVRNSFLNLLPLPFAVAEKEGTAIFHVDPENEGESSLIGEGAECHTVQVTSLDTLFKNGLPLRPRVIKIDVEGVELSVLEGGRRFFDMQPPDMVICEINRGTLARNGHTEWDIRGFFKERGYRCAVINIESGGLDLRGGRFYATVPDDRLAAPDCPYVFNLMFLRKGSDLYPDDVL